MTKTMTPKMTRAICATIACGFVMFSATPAVAADSRPSAAQWTTKDGLTEIADPVMGQASIKPGVDLRKYETLVVLPTTIKAFESSGFGSDYPVSEQQLKFLREVVPAALVDSLSDLTDLELTFTRQPKGLVLEIAVIDVVSHVPPESAGRGATYSRMLGAATLAIELRDATTNAVVARAIERREIARHNGYRSSRSWNQEEVRDAAERLGDNVRKQIEEFTEVSARTVAAR